MSQALIRNQASLKKEQRAMENIWPTYRRLLGYALRYKSRIAAMVILSILVAGSLSSMILAAGPVINMLFMEDSKAADYMQSMTAQTRSALYGDLPDSESPLGGFLARARLGERVTGLSGDDFEERMGSSLNNLRENRSRVVLVMAIGLIVLTAIASGARFLQEYYGGAIGVSVSTKLQEEMYANVINLPHLFFEKRSSGEILTRFTSDALLVRQGLAEVFIKAIREPIKIATFMVVAVSISPQLTFLILFVLAPILFLVIGIGNRIRRNVHRSLDRLAAVASTVSETVKGISIVKAFGMEKAKNARMRNELSGLRRQLKNIVRAEAAVSPATEFFTVLGVAAFLVMSDSLVSQGDLSGTNLIVLFVALAASVDPLRKLAKMSNMIQMSTASGQRVFEFIDAKSAIEEKPDARELQAIGESLRFEDVHFHYGDADAEVLSGVNFEVRKGEMVALVGFSGGGKSTVAKLIPRFYDPTGGRIMLDGVDLRDATLSSLRAQIGLVTQESILFSETVGENIACGRGDVDRDSIVRSAVAANADGFIEEMSEGYDSLLTEAGGNLSGGQRQRVSIARAILKDPPILILDEATSSLDSKSEQAIMNAMDEFVEGRTTLVIAHRLSTIRKADRIVVLDGGLVAEQGSHDELLARGGLYERLYKMQFASAAEARTAP